MGSDGWQVCSGRGTRQLNDLAGDLVGDAHTLRYMNVSASTLEIRNMHIGKGKGTYCTFLVDNVHL